MSSKNVKPLIALAITSAGSALVVAFHVPDMPVVGNASAASSTTTAPVAAQATPRATATPSATDSVAQVAEPTPTATPEPTQATNNASPYADGTYTGEAEQEPWGTFQVEVTVSGGVIANVSVVSEPTDGHSSRINGIAVPILTQSVLSAQSANVDLVSGATWTSDSYLTSLQAALDEAAAQNGN